MDAVAVCVPLAVPNVHRVSAIPSVPVVELLGEMPPEVTLQPTMAPATALPLASTTRARKGAASWEPAIAD
jgi:hypothetical protein